MLKCLFIKVEHKNKVIVLYYNLGQVSLFQLKGHH